MSWKIGCGFKSVVYNMSLTSWYEYVLSLVSVTRATDRMIEQGSIDKIIYIWSIFSNIEWSVIKSYNCIYSIFIHTCLFVAFLYTPKRFKTYTIFTNMLLIISLIYSSRLFISISIRNIIIIMTKVEQLKIAWIQII